MTRRTGKPPTRGDARAERDFQAAQWRKWTTPAGMRRARLLLAEVRLLAIVPGRRRLK
jgi:hypothetical protein